MMGEALCLASSLDMNIGPQDKKRRAKASSVKDIAEYTFDVSRLWTRMINRVASRL